MAWWVASGPGGSVLPWFRQARYAWEVPSCSLEKVQQVPRVRTVWPSLPKAAKTLNEAAPARQHPQLGARGGRGASVRGSCPTRWSLGGRRWGPGSSAPCGPCRGSPRSAPSAWRRFRSGSGWTPPTRMCPSGPGSGGGSKCSAVSGPRRQNCFQRCHWATDFCSQERRAQITGPAGHRGAVMTLSPKNSF